MIWIVLFGCLVGIGLGFLLPMVLAGAVTAGKVFGAAESVDNTKLNLLGVPSVAISGAADSTQVAASGYFYQAVPTGTANAIVLTLSPVPPSLAPGMVVRFRVATTNTGAVTLNVNSLGVKSVYKRNSMEIAAGEFCSGLMVEVIYDSSADAWFWLGGVGERKEVRGSAENLVVKNNAANPDYVVDVSADRLVLQHGDSGDCVVAANVSFSVSMAGSGSGGLDTGAEAASTWYYVWAICTPGAATLVLGLLSTSATAPTLPAGVTHKALVGVVRNNAGSNFVRFYQTGRVVFAADTVVFTAKQAAAADTYELLAGADLTAFQALVPPIAKEVMGNFGATTGSAVMAVAADADGVGSCSVAAATAGVAWNSFTASASYRIGLRTAQQVYWKSYDNVTARNRMTVSGYAI